MPDGLRAFVPAEALRPQRPLLQPTLGDAQPPLAQAAPTDLHPCAGTATPRLLPFPHCLNCRGFQLRVRLNRLIIQSRNETCPYYRRFGFSSF